VLLGPKWNIRDDSEQGSFTITRLHSPVTPPRTKIEPSSNNNPSQDEKDKLTASEMLKMLERFNSGPQGSSREMKWGFW